MLVKKGVVGMKFILVTLQLCLLFTMILFLAIDIMKKIEDCIDKKIEERINKLEESFLIEQWQKKQNQK